jgi:phage shock protein PspC (stress-responsive transcriptional regulator)
MNKTLTRSSTDKYLAGVSGGMAEYFGVDANVVRVGWIIATVFTGVAIFAYLGIAMFIPSDDRVPSSNNHDPLPV